MKYWYETLAVTQRILTQLIRRRRSLIFWSIFPLSILLINSSILVEKTKLSLPVAMKFAAPSALVGAALFFSCLGGTIATVVAEREEKTLKRLFISPLSGTSYFLGIFLAHCLIGIGQTVLVYSVIFWQGERISGSVILGLTIVLLSIAGYVGVGFILGTQLAKRTEDVNALVATFGVPMLILGGAFFPTSLFPEKLVEVAKFNPVYHMNEALVGIWAKKETFFEIESHFFFLLIFSLIMSACGWLCYQQMLRLEKTL